MRGPAQARAGVQRTPRFSEAEPSSSSGCRPRSSPAGAEILVSELRANLERRGFKADVVNVPFKWYPVSELVRQALAWRLLDLTESNGTMVDLVIPTKFPSFLARHPRKVAWLFHQHREAYDLFGTSYCSFTTPPRTARCGRRSTPWTTPPSGNAARIYTISRNVADRLSRYNAPARHAAVPAAASPRPLPRRRPRRLPLLRRPAGPPEAARSRHRRHAAGAQRARA